MSQKNDKRYNLTFGQKDGEAAAWFYAHENKGAYLKALILEDMQKAGAHAKEAKPREDAAIHPAVQSAGRSS